MNKKELSALYWLNREIEDQQKRLHELEDVAVSTTGVITGMPRGYGIGDKVGRSAVEIADLKKQIKLNVEKCWLELDRLNRYIDEIEDSQVRQILRLRYINGLCWRQVAQCIGEVDEQVPRRMHDRWLRGVR